MKFNLNGTEFHIDQDGGIYKAKGNARDYYLTDDECRAIIQAGGVKAIIEGLQ